jgi:hypothetical protein
MEGWNILRCVISIFLKEKKVLWPYEGLCFFADSIRRLMIVHEPRHILAETYTRNSVAL